MIKKLLKGVIALALLLIFLVFLKVQFIGKAFDEKAFESYIQKPVDSNGIKLTFLGTSCFIIEHKGKQAVCDPYFSNPNLIGTTFGKIPYPALSKHIDSNLYQNVKLITISHGHYDHCLDIGNFLKAVPNTTVAADPGIHNELSSLYTGKNIIPQPIRKDSPKAWIYATDSSFRTFALESVHSPHFANVTLFTGQFEDALNELPGKLWQWKLCECNSYMIDVLGNGNIHYRVLMCTGNMNQKGFDDLEKLSGERKTDLLLHIFWKNKECKENLEHAYAIAKPNTVILHHWNNFFRGNDRSLQHLRSCEFPESIDELHEEGIMGKIMIPFATINL